MSGSFSSICVYCGSGFGKNPDFRDYATEFGHLLGQNNIRLVYGGGHVGLMGAIADAVMTSGGEVIGVIPEHLAQKEVAHTGLTELHIVKNMHERKKMMFEKSDAFVVLPGGFGTLEEMFEILTWRQLQLHNKPLLLANFDQYWSPLLSVLEHMVAEKFAGQAHMSHISLADTVQDILPTLEKAPRENVDIKLKWQ